MPSAMVDEKLPLFFSFVSSSLQFLAAPATQVTSERSFSTVGNIVMADRMNLLNERVEELIFCHENLPF